MAKIKFDFNNMMAGRIGACQGIREEEVNEIAPLIEQAFTELENGQWGFRKLPLADELVKKLNVYADSVAGKFENLVVVGIGGSALGNRALHSALHHPLYNLFSQAERGGKPRFFVLENVDPDTVAALARVIDCKKTLFNVITKSGSTAETMSKFIILRKLLREAVGEKKYRKNFVFTTDPEKGTLRELARNEGISVFAVPPDVGGRFSVLSAVGLFSAALTGINIAELLDGAKEMDQSVRQRDIWQNPACLSAVLQYLFYKKGRPLSVFMPYSDRLKDLSEWFAQLWAESLGKAKNKNNELVAVGSTPIKAVGAIDQHSQLQLYMEGPEDKVVRFIRVNEFAEIVTIPAELQEYSGISYLGGHSLNELINAEQLGTELALTKQARPNCTITLSAINPGNLGALIYMLEVETAFMGQLLQIDPFNQPGVELSKQITYALLGRPGYEDRKKDIEQLPKKNNRYSFDW